MEINPVIITERALAEIEGIISQKKIPEGYFLRIGMKGGGCGAAGFFLGFDSPTEHDKKFIFGKVEVLIDKRHIMYLLDMHVDFEERKDEQGFVFLKNDEVVKE
ncbi:MAG: iron-sulfur cluster assembly accessory protein [Thalassobius sp.]|nr:iron-sulfur cluster assembly accessory protein [Thalassovita sp.]